MEVTMEIKAESGREEKQSKRVRVFTAESQEVRIERAAMKNNIRIRSANLENIRQIGEEAFMGCTCLQQVRLENLRRIEKRAFNGCSRLKTVQFPASVYKILPGAFQNSRRLQSVVFRKSCGLKELENEVFSGCSGLLDVRLPGKLYRIGRKAFYKCISLEEIEFPISLRIIGQESFYQCGLRELELPEGLLEIGESAFLKCKNLEYVYVPDTVRKIGKWAFHGCSSLKVLEINHDPEEIGEWITNKVCTIRCPQGSRMEAYARHYGMPVEYTISAIDNSFPYPL